MLLGLPSLSPPLATAHASRPDAVSPPPSPGYTVRAACPAPAPGRASCLALKLVPVSPAARAHRHTLGRTRGSPIALGVTAPEECEVAPAAEGCDGLRPQDLHAAYSLPTETPSSSTQTIALVDAYNDPDAEKDLKVYDKAFRLPACTAADGCLTIVNQSGEAGNLPFPHTIRELRAARKGSPAEYERAVHAGGWAGEISVDIEIAHAICQNCHILLVESESESYEDLEAAENSAVRLKATEVSNSWYGQEPLTDSAAFDDPGTVITAAAGDYGYLNWSLTEEGSPPPDEPATGFVDYPASSPHVIAVGGTTLELDSLSNTWKSEVWNYAGGAGGSGCSERFEAPRWQQELADWSSVGCASSRAVADVSADGDPFTGVAIYDSTPDERGVIEYWEEVGGTSVGSPLIAATFALAGGAGGVEYAAQTLYERAASLDQVESGSNGECSKGHSSECTALEEAESCSRKAICLAGPGYNGPAGLGAPNGLGAFEPPVGPRRKTQLITFTSGAPGSATVGCPSYEVAAMASSGLAVSFSSGTPAACSVTGPTVSFVGVGTCTITANQTGGPEYDPSPQAQQSFAVAKGEQAITFTSSAPGSATVAGQSYEVTATASSGLAVAFSSRTLAVCSLTASTVSFIAPGTCTIEAHQAGDSNYDPAPEAQQSFAVKRAQVIAFTSSAPASATLGGPGYAVTARASSRLAVSLFSGTPRVCSLTGSTVSFLGVGTCTLDAEQAGNVEYYPAPEARQSFAVGEGTQAITFTSATPSAASVGGKAYTVTATASSGLAVSFSSGTPSVCSLAASTVSFIGAGTCTIDADQAGDSNYQAAPQVEQSFTVGAAPGLSTAGSLFTLPFASSFTPTPDSNFNLLANPRINARTGAITFVVSVADPGAFTWRLSFQNGKFGAFQASTAKCPAAQIELEGRCRPARVIFAEGSTAVASAGSVSITLKPDPPAVKALRNAHKKGRSLALTATLTFQSSLGGRPASRSLSLADRLSEADTTRPSSSARSQ